MPLAGVTVRVEWASCTETCPGSLTCLRPVGLFSQDGLYPTCRVPARFPVPGPLLP